MYSAYAGVAPGEVSAALWKTVKILHNSAHTCTQVSNPEREYICEAKEKEARQE